MKQTLDQFKASSYRQLIHELKAHIITMQAMRAIASSVSLGFLDACEEHHQEELETLKRKLRMCLPQKAPTIGGISSDDIARAKLTPISNYIRVGHDHKAVCLFHDDKHASLHVYPDGYHCFSCQAHGTVIDIVMKLHNLSFVEAVKELI